MDDLTDLLARLLDAGYTKAVRPVLTAIDNDLRTGIIGKRLDALDQEAKRLAEAGEVLRPDNALVRALLADLKPILENHVHLMGGVSPELQEQAVKAGRLWFEQTTLPPAVQYTFNRPDPQAVMRLVDYATSQAWQNELARYTSANLELLQNAVIRGFLRGYHPVRTARELRQLAGDFPKSQANNLLRTLQLYSYRGAAAIHQIANANIIDKVIRVSALDTRCCLACIALHGTSIQLGNVVSDHHQGRCTSLVITKGRQRDIELGTDWFARQSPSRQLTLAGHANFEALRSGKISLSDFVGTYQDPVFHEMIRENSLKGILGQAAQDYYAA